MESIPEPLAMVGGYTLLERIGKGGMGEVWRAERTVSGGVRRRAAVKRILPRFQRDAVLRERFIAEARITARLEHPNVVQVLDFGDSPELYLILEYVDGTSVAELLRRAARREGPLPLTAVLHIIAEAATGLDYAHRRTDDQGHALSIVHRDVSPANMLVSSAGAVKVNDFGVARAADNLYRTEAGLAVGKLVYMAPEQARGGAVDRRADIFALGICLWELLALRPLVPRGSPSDALSWMRTCSFTRIAELVPGAPPEIDALLARAMSPDPDARPATASEFGRVLRRLLATVAPGFEGRDLARVVRRLVPELDAGGLVDPISDAGAPSISMPIPQAMPAMPVHATASPVSSYGAPVEHTRASVPHAMSASQNRMSAPGVPSQFGAPDPSRPSFPGGAMPMSAPRASNVPVGAFSPAAANFAPGSPALAPGAPPGVISQAPFAPPGHPPPMLAPAPAAPSAHQRALPTGVVVALVLAIVVVAALATGVVYLLRTRASGAAAGATQASGSSTAAPMDSTEAFVRDAYVRAMQIAAPSCARLLGVAELHGSAHADFTVALDGSVTDPHLRIEGLAEPFATGMSNCMMNELVYGHTPSMGHVVVYRDVVVTF